MLANTTILLPALAGALIGLLVVALAAYAARRMLARSREHAERLIAEARQDGESQAREILVATQERGLALQEEIARQEREVLEHEGAVDQATRELERAKADLERERQRVARHAADVQRRDPESRELLARARAADEEARSTLERIAGMSASEARAQLIAEIETEARTEGARLARKIEDEARESAEREAVHLMVHASQRVNLREVLESTVSFIELPSDEMKGRIIGREGRNIRALEMATGIDLVVDDTPRSILISSFNPIRREIARVAIDRLVTDGRIHPARIEEVTARVREEFDDLVDAQGSEATYGLGISTLHPRLIRLVGRMRYHTSHGQNLLQHCLESAMIAAEMAREIGAGVEIVRRAGLLHEIAQVEATGTDHPIAGSAELAAKYGESEEVVHAIRSLHAEVESRSTEAILVGVAKRMSDQRPGARKENLAVYIERLKRLEKIAEGFSGVDRAYAVKAGKEIRVLLDAKQSTDQQAQQLSKQIARTIERELSFSGQIKVSVIRETRAVRFAI